MFENIITFFKALLSGLIASESILEIVSEGIAFISLFAFSVIVYYLVRFIISRTLVVFIYHTKTQFDDMLLKNKVISRASYFVPAYIIREFTAFTLPSFPKTVALIQYLVNIYIIFIWMILIAAFISSFYDYYNTKEIGRAHV